MSAQRITKYVIVLISLVLGVALIVANLRLPAYVTNNIIKDDIAIAITSIVIAAAALFVSLALAFWRQQLEFMDNNIRYVLDKVIYFSEKNGQIANALKESLSDLRCLRRSLARGPIAKLLEKIYWATIALSIIVLIFLIGSRIALGFSLVTADMFSIIVEAALMGSLFVALFSVVGMVFIVSVTRNHSKTIEKSIDDVLLGIGMSTNN